MSMEISVRIPVRTNIVRALLLSMTGALCLAQARNSTEPQRQKAIVLEEQGQSAEAEAAWHAYLRAHPGSAEAYAHIGLLEARQEHYAEAISSYRKALAINPVMPGLRLNLGLSLFKSGAMKEAIQTFAPLRKSLPPSSPDWLRVTTLMGLAHYGIGEYAAAVPYLKEATARDPQNLPFRLTLAHSCLWSKQYQCVLDVYREILTLNAESAEADMLAGEALDEMQNDTGAIQQFRAAVKADPKEPNVHFGLGYLLWRQSQFEEAAKEFEAELVNVPDNAQAMAFLGNSYMHTNRSGEALPLLEKAVQIEPRLERAHLDLGVLYSDRDRKEDAVRELQEAARLSPEDPEAHWRLARLYQAMGKKEEAKAEFQKTSNLKKAANDTILNRLKAAQERGKPSGSPAAPALQQ